MSELLNQKSSIQGKVHSGYLNSIFDLSGNWLHDATDTKTLAFDGYFISLYYLHLTAFPLVLNDRVKKSVPPHWDPAALSRFIQTYGTHIIVGMAIGGQDLICFRQNSSSTIPTSELRGYLEDLGDVMFSDGKSPSLIQRKSRDGKQKCPTSLTVFCNQAPCSWPALQKHRAFGTLREEADELCQTLEEKEDSSCTASDQFSCITI